MPKKEITNEIDRFISSKEIVDGWLYEAGEKFPCLMLKTTISKQSDPFCYISWQKDIVPTNKLLLIKPDQLDRMVACGLMGITMTNERDVFVVEYIFDPEADKETILNIL